ncbi:MAG: hypothetical protein WCR29_01590 [Bacteroidales bacterium]
MRKYSIMLCAMCFISIGLFAQTSSTENNEDQKHHFGIGLTTDIFAGNRDMNSFKTNIFEYDISLLSSNQPYANLDLYSSSYWGLYLEYQYDFCEKFSASSRLKFTFRDNTYHYNYSDFSPSNNKRFFTMHAYDVSITSLEIPLILNYNIPMSQDLSFITSLGGGLNFTLYKPDYSIEGKTYASDLIDRTYYLDFEVLNTVSPFLYIGTALDFNWNNHKIRTTLSYTIYPMYNYRFNHYIKGDNINIVFEDSPFSQNNLELGLAFFW